MPLTHNDISDAVKNAGYYTVTQEFSDFPNRTICVTEKSNRNYRGTSCYAIAVNGEWFVCSLAYRYWKVTEESNIVPVVLEWLNSKNGPGAPPAHVIDNYGIIEIDDKELGKIVEFWNTTSG